MKESDKKIGTQSSSVKPSYALDEVILGRLKSSRNIKDKEVVQLIEHYRNVIRTQRLQIALLTKQVRKSNPY